jgi:hypothetical protein
MRTLHIAVACRNASGTAVRPRRRFPFGKRRFSIVMSSPTPGRKAKRETLDFLLERRVHGVVVMDHNMQGVLP